MKNHIISADIPALAELGVKGAKLTQINRFLELLADETDSLKPETQINIIDFGCGKSYLTFYVHHYFAHMKNFRVQMCGLDLNAEIIANCKAIAEKNNYDTLKFLQGDIGSQSTPPLENWGAPNSFNIMISLHACDTATDHAIYNAIRWHADLICAVPCCQHELRNQMKPKTLGIFAEYGIIEERIAALATDAIRAKLLEIHGYKAQIIEFAAMEHTAKNLLIRARRGKSCENPESLQALIAEFSFEPTLLRLLQKKTGTA